MSLVIDCPSVDFGVSGLFLLNQMNMGCVLPHSEQSDFRDVLLTNYSDCYWGVRHDLELIQMPVVVVLVEVAEIVVNVCWTYSECSVWCAVNELPLKFADIYFDPFASSSAKSVIVESRCYVIAATAEAMWTSLNRPMCTLANYVMLWSWLVGKQTTEHWLTPQCYCSRLLDSNHGFNCLKHFEANKPES